MFKKSHALVPFLLLFIFSPISSALSVTFPIKPLILRYSDSREASMIGITNEKGEVMVVKIGELDGEQSLRRLLFRKSRDERDYFFPKIVAIKDAEDRLVRISFKSYGLSDARTCRVFIEKLSTEEPGELTVKMSLEVERNPFSGVVHNQIIAQKPDDNVVVKILHGGVSNHYKISKALVRGINDVNSEVFVRNIPGTNFPLIPSGGYTLDINENDQIKLSQVVIDLKIERSISGANTTPSSTAKKSRIRRIIYPNRDNVSYLPQKRNKEFSLDIPLPDPKAIDVSLKNNPAKFD